MHLKDIKYVIRALVDLIIQTIISNTFIGINLPSSRVFLSK